MTKNNVVLKRLLWGLNQGSTDHQSGMLTITLNCQLWVRDTEKLSLSYSHAWLILVEFI